MSGLVKCNDIKIRECFHAAFADLCKDQVSLQHELLEVLLAELKDIPSYAKTTKEFFQLTKGIINSYLGKEEFQATDSENNVCTLVFKQAAETLKGY